MEAMQYILVGTAGHIDHGKTSLVRALTGIDTDRLEEEKRRGITIDLGFAHLQLTPDLQMGFVDVPGHERFVKNMLAGIGGIDLVLFVVAADESIKPQTREHFDICRLLGISRGVIALTKADLVDREIMDLVRLEVEELVAGSFLEGAAIVPVSSTTGQGLPELREALESAAKASKPSRDSEGQFRLPIDRVFSVKGFGTVVTGTLFSGSVAKEQEVEVYPSGRRLRVRGVQVHGAAAARAMAGQRTALNLSDIDPAELRRGDVLSEPDRFHAATRFDCHFDLLPSAKALKNRAPVHFHSGTAEIEADVRLFGAAVMRPGARAYARLTLREPALLLPGDRFIIRSFSPVVTIGGGVVLDIGDHRYRQGEDAAERLRVLESKDAAVRIALLVKEAPFGMGISDLIARTALPQREIAAAAAKTLAVIAQPAPWYVDRSWLETLQKELVKVVGEFHRRNPLLPGIPRQDLRARVFPERRGTAAAPQFLLDAALSGVRELVSEGEIVRARAHKLVLKEEEEQARAAIEQAFERAGLATPAVAVVLAQSGVETSRARSLLQILLRERRLVRVSEELVFHRSALEGLRQLLAARKSTRFTVAAFKDWTGISRKYAIPLLEYLDRERITRRDGEERLVL
jgi:selenocysteine-specific elongation factor